MNPIYEVVTAAEAAELWDFEESTIRRALWQGRIAGRKSSKIHLVTLTEMRRVYGEMPEHNACNFIADELTREDVKMWHEETEATQNVSDLLEATGIDCIQIWGSFDGSEPITVNLC